MFLKLLIFFVYLMIMFKNFFNNHFHQEFLGPLSLNGVGIICVIFVTLNFSYCMVMESPHSFIANVHSTMALFSSSINTPIDPILRLLVLPFIK